MTVNPLRIGVDARLRAYRGGGIATHVACLLAGLAAIDPPEEIVVLAHRRETAAGGPFATRRLATPPHHRLEGWTLPLELLPARLQLLHAPDFVVPHAWPGASVATIHDLAFLRHPEFLTADSRRYYGQVHAAIQKADRLIAVSEHTRREILALTGAEAGRIRVVANAVHPRYSAAGDATADAAVTHRLSLRTPFILFVSTIEPRKNVITLLEAFRRLVDSGRGESLALVGADGWHSGEVYRRAEVLGLTGRAQFLGFVPDAELAALYRSAAVLAHPALDEGFGLTPLEAMASGTPTVVADAGSLPELVDQAALRVPPQDVAAWAAALARVLDSPALAAELAAAGRRRAANYSTSRMARETMEVYREARLAWQTRAARYGLTDWREQAGKLLQFGQPEEPGQPGWSGKLGQLPQPGQSDQPRQPEKTGQPDQPARRGQP